MTAKNPSGKGSDHPAGLNREEERLARKHSSPRAVVIHEIIRADGEQELERTVGALALSGFAAGLSMGFSFLTQAFIHASLPNAPWRHAVESFGYCIGFVIVVLGRQQLFTESTLTAVLPLLTNRDLKTLGRLLRLFAIVLAANLAGTWIFALVLQIKMILPVDTTPALHELAQISAPQGFAVMLMKGVISGWLIALMVWILPAVQSERLSTVFTITYVVGLGGFAHIIAGSTEAAYGVLTGLSTVQTYFFHFALPTVIGNTLGGVILVSCLNHGAIAPEIGKA